MEQDSYFCDTYINKMKLHNYRKQYSKDILDETQVPDDPIVLFRQWFELASKQHAHEANTMVLSTVFDNRPSARVVLLKEVFEGGFVFFTNYESRKGIELETNPFACLTFFWPEFERQIRIEGSVRRVSDEISDNYFNSRPEQSRISAIISPQSQVIASKAVLMNKKNEFITKAEDLKRPFFWGGYSLLPEAIEFWQGRPDRLHDRVKYVKNGLEWAIQRLAP
ncbi:MAG: pyridoxamine 5'-phosphate oxidase [Bacteroidales bacterium]|nr:pyridoxamine 5'-phosphate oxidase [Bacteroidales bacterium]